MEKHFQGLHHETPHQPLPSPRWGDTQHPKVTVPAAHAPVSLPTPSEQSQPHGCTGAGGGCREATEQGPVQQWPWPRSAAWEVQHGFGTAATCTHRGSVLSLAPTAGAIPTREAEHPQDRQIHAYLKPSHHTDLVHGPCFPWYPRSWGGTALVKAQQEFLEDMDMLFWDEGLKPPAGTLCHNGACWLFPVLPAFTMDRTRKANGRGFSQEVQSPCTPPKPPKQTWLGQLHQR